MIHFNNSSYNRVREVWSMKSKTIGQERMKLEENLNFILIQSETWCSTIRTPPPWFLVAAEQDEETVAKLILRSLSDSRNGSDWQVFFFVLDIVSREI